MAYVRFVKLVVLVAGALGVAGFFLPFRTDRHGSVTAREALSRVEEDPTICEPTKVRGVNLSTPECQSEHPEHRSFIPFYFASSAALVVFAVIALVRRRLGGLLALLTLAAGLLADGGWMRERRVQGGLDSGATLLAISGLLAIAAAIVVLAVREPDPPRKRPPPRVPELPEARVIPRS